MAEEAGLGGGSQPCIQGLVTFTRLLFRKQPPPFQGDISDKQQWHRDNSQRLSKQRAESAGQLENCSI